MDLHLSRAGRRALSWIVAAGLSLTPIFAHATAVALPDPDLPEAPEAAPTNVKSWIKPEQINPKRKAKYHWKGLLVQSLEFNLIENGFRLAMDDTMRFQLMHKPFWHDYAASIKQYNMGRWSDGDSFLVNYVGHPLQGSVGAFIEVQNSESQARLQWNEPGYWRSRWLAFLWTTVYSTHSEISPIGEAGIGSEGGFTYGTKCMEHCDASNFHAGHHYTNNTGWVDFIVTPTVGMLWVFTEDWIDKDVVPWIVDDDHSLARKVLRGSLNPSRSFANLLRGRTPWYRDYEHPVPSVAYDGVGEHFLPSDQELQWRRSLPRFQIAPHFNGLSIATTTAGCTYCRAMTTGAGVEFSARLLPFVDFDGDLSYQPGASAEASDRAGGNALRGVFGLRAGYETPHYAVRVAIRPGFVRWDRAYTTSPTTVVLPNNQLGPNRYVETGMVIENPPPKLGPILHFDWNANLTGDYKLSDTVALRVGIGEDLVRYRTNMVAAPGIGDPPYVSWLSHENYITRGNWSYQLGPVFSF